MSRPPGEWSQREPEIAGTRLFARLIVGVLGGLLLGIAGAGLCMLAFGSDSGYWALLLVWIAGIGTALLAPDITRASRWLLIAAGIGVLLLVFSSAIVSDQLLPGEAGTLHPADRGNDVHTLLLGLLLGGLALFSGLWIGRDPAPRQPPRSEAGNKADFDSTAATGKLPVLKSPRTVRPMQYALIAGALLIVCGTMVWSTRDRSPVIAAPATTAPEPADVPLVAAKSEAGSTAPPAQSTAPAVSGATPLSPSQARQECMAQIEAARLFLGLARASDSRGAYEVRVGKEIERFRRDRPVGPRTLTMISTAMWSRRESPDPDAGVWSREYSQCEQTRSGGSFYVVRGGR